MSQQRTPFSVEIPQICRESASKARERLSVQALGLKRRADGNMRFGDVRIDAAQYYLRQVKETKSIRVRGLKRYLDRLWESDVEVRRFLIRLGRALESSAERGQGLDWSHKVDQTLRRVVEHWCDSGWVDGRLWPPLCVFTSAALEKFLSLNGVTYCQSAASDPRTIERAVQRLGLVKIPRQRFRQVAMQGGRFHFA